MREPWIVLRDDPAVGWQGHVPLPTDAASALQAAIELAGEVLAAGADADVLRLATADAEGGDVAPLDYAMHLRDAAERTGIVPFFTLLIDEWPAPRQLRTSGRVAYHHPTGEVVELDVDDLGTLLEELRPDLAAESSPFVGHVAPLEVFGGPIDLRGDGARAATVRVASHSDIWFPQVLGILDGAPPPHERLRYGNRDLAAVHTPRLNRFVRAVRAAVERRGGTWTVIEPEGVARRYAPWVSANGIALDLGSRPA